MTAAWKKYGQSPILPELLPIIPPDGKLAEGSTVTPAMRGKTPGLLREHGWVGLGGKWKDERFTTLDEAKAYWKMGASIGVQTRHYIAIDIDVDSPKIAKAIEELCTRMLGFAPVRLREGSSRVLLVYALDGEPIHKHRLAFKFKNKKHAVECLGNGQQFVAEGIHPSGKPYTWRDGSDLVDWASKLTRVTLDDVDAFFEALANLIKSKGGEIITKQASSAGGTRLPLTDATLHAPSLARMLNVFKAIKLEKLESYDDAVRLIAAAKAAAFPWAAEAVDDILEHFLSYPGATDDFFFKRWDSVTDAELGWSWLLDLAREHGYEEPVEEVYDDDIAAQAAIDIEKNKHPEDAMLDGFTWVRDLGRYFDHSDHSLITADAFNTLNVRVARYGRSGERSAHAFFQNHPKRRVVKIATYKAGSPAHTNEDGVAAVNLWRPSRIVPADAARGEIDVRAWLDLGERLFGSDLPAILDWMAFVYQCQDQKVNYGVLVIGRQGVGKDTFFDPFFEAIGKPNNARMVSPEELAGDFNPHMLARVVCVQEMMNFEKKAMYNRHKKYLAVPPHFVSINNKNEKRYDIPNRHAWVFFTNHDDAMPMEFDDRRFAVYRCQIEKPISDAYYARVWGWYKAGGYEQVAAFLLARDVPHFNPMAPPTMTEAKQEMIDGATPAAILWLREQLMEGGIYHARTLVNPGEIVEQMQEQDVWANAGTAMRQIPQTLRAHAWRPFPNVIKVNGKPIRLWARGDVELWKPGTSPATIAERYLKECAA